MMSYTDTASRELVEEFAEQVETFRRNFLVRMIALLAAAGWLVGMIVLFVERTSTVAIAFLGFEALLWAAYIVCTRGHLRAAQYLFAITLGAYSLGLAHLQPAPALLFLPVIVGPVAVAVLQTRSAVIFSAALVVGQIITAAQVFADTWISWPLLLAPLMTAVSVGLALIWSVNLLTVLGWAFHSTRTALDRLEEVQAHRAELRKSMEERDLTVQRLERANEMLAAARAEAEAVRQARNQFALTVSHELRTPLNFIIGFSELMVSSPATYAERHRWPPGLYEDIKEIYANSNHLMRLVNDILELGQAEARRLILAKEWIAPARIVKETESIMRAAIAARHLFFRVEVAPDLPDLFVDRTRIRQVLINLIGNSLRYTEEGGITLSVKRRAMEVVFCVLDTGVGIPADEVSKVFDDFGQANATVWRRRGGSGLGVPISRRFVEMHGGRMWLESEVGLGTSFYFSLPLPGTVAEPVEPAGEERWRAYFDGPKTAKALVVLSPDPNASHLIETYASAYRVIGAVDAAAAAEAIANLLPHALILDRALATHPGARRLIESLPYDLPVIELSLPGAVVEPPALPPGARSYLLKPLRRDALARAVASLPNPVRSLLVVDDDPAMARFVGLALSSAGNGASPPQVEGIMSGEALLRRVRGEDGAPTPPDLVLLDLKLGDMNGLDALDAMQREARWRDVPVFLVTAANLSEEVAGQVRDAIQASIARPLTADEMGAALNALLSALNPTITAASAVQARRSDPPA
jgi:signal transduction histidine kinase/DNA-binding response OmpR family regulator